MKYALSLLLVLVAATPTLSKKKPVQDCKVSFAFVYVDRRNNTNRGLQGKPLKDVQNKLSKYGDVCYTDNESAADFVFFVHTKPAVYHGGIPIPAPPQIRSTEQSRTRTGILPRSAELPLQRALRLFRMKWIILCSFSTLWFRTRRTAQRKHRIGCFEHLTKRVYTTRCTESGTARASIPSLTSLMQQRSGCTKTISANDVYLSAVVLNSQHDKVSPHPRIALARNQASQHDHERVK